MMEIGIPLRRIRQFLFHVRSYGFWSACRTTWLFFRVRANSFLNLAGIESHGDMPWAVFESRFLSRRDAYKGVFVQNPVITWNEGLFQRPQQMALALGRLGYLVIYKTPDPTLDKVVGVRNIAPNVYLANAECFDFIDGAFHSVYSTITAFAFDGIEKSDSCFRVIYEYVDHIDPAISGKEAINHLLEEKRIAFNENKYDFIVATARELADEAVKAVCPDKVLYVPNGVDCWHYRNPVQNNISLPNNLLKFKENYENIVGYFGAIAPWLWYDEIKKLTNNRPDLGFVFIGPDYSGREVARLPRTENVLWLDAVSYEILPAYASQFDVCFIPFEPGPIAHTTSPLKLFEYFALEKPVIATSQMHECTAFDVVFAGDSAESWSAAIDNAISLKSDIIFREKLTRLADENSWDNRARSMEYVFLGRDTGEKDEEEVRDEIAMIGPILQRLMWADHNIRRQIQKWGVNVLPINIYSNSPSLDEVDTSFEYEESQSPPYLNDHLFNREMQRVVLEKLTIYSPEFDPPIDGDEEKPNGYFWKNGQFSYSDAMAYYCFIRQLRPSTILEIGSGFSTLVAIQAIGKNGTGEIHCVEPYPRPFLVEAAHITLHKRVAESLDIEFINDLLSDGDVLFIDSTHTVKSGSDCLNIYLRLLPGVRHNIFVHVHDVFLPYGLPKPWLIDKQIFWTEQYLLMGFLLDNPKTQILFGSNYADHFLSDKLTRFMGGKAIAGGGSLWFSYNGRDNVTSHRDGSL